MPPTYRQAILFAYICFITFLFLLPGSALPKQSWLNDIWFDKWVHIGLFSVLSFFACWVWAGRRKHFVLILLCTASAYGLIIELIQHQFIPNRSMDPGDWIADIIGTAMGIFIWRFKTKGYTKK